MPDIDGVKVVEQLRELDERMSIIVMTAYPDLETATQTMRHGTCRLHPKPFKQDELITAVDRACQKLGLIYTSEGELNRLIGKRIREERLSQNLTLRQLSDRTDLTTSQLSQVELARTRPRSGRSHESATPSVCSFPRCCRAVERSADGIADEILPP